MQHQTIGHKSPRQIEAQLDQDRDALVASLDMLRKRFSLDNVWSDGASLIKANAGPYTQALDAAVRANPLALSVTAIGMAWLIFGRRGEGEVDHSSLAGTRFEAEARWEDEGGPVQDLPESDALWMEAADRLRLRASGLIARINAAARDNLVPAAELAKSRADVAAALAKDVRRVMAQGLETLTGTARHAALAGRESVYMAHLAAAKIGAQAVRDNPVVAGIAIALAGAAVAALLPQSSFENQVLAAPRDRLLHDAKRVLQDERQRVAKSVERVAQALAAEFAPSRTKSTAEI
jgi:hypothetical protein